MNEEFLGQWWIVRLSELEPRWSMPYTIRSSHLRRSTASTTEAYGDGRDRKHLFSLPSTRLLSAVKACGRRIRRASKASRGKLSAGKKFSVLVDFINYPQMSMKLFCAWIFILEKFQQKKLHKLIINFLCVLAQTELSCSWVCYLTRNSRRLLFAKRYKVARFSGDFHFLQIPVLIAAFALTRVSLNPICIRRWMTRQKGCATRSRMWLNM